MSIWEDLDDGFSNKVVGDTREAYLPSSTNLKEVEINFDESYMPEQKISATDLTVTVIEEDGQIIGMRLSGIHGIRPEENFHTNMRIEEDGEDILLYDKEWAAIHETELDIILNSSGEESNETDS